MATDLDAIASAVAHENRALGVALLASLALHGALFLALPALREAQQRRTAASEPILVRLTEPQAKPAVSTAPPQPIHEAQKSISPSRAPKLQPQVRPTPTQTAPAQPLSTEPRAESEVAPAPLQAAPVRQPVQATAGLSSADALPAQATPEAPDAGTLAQYRLAVISAAKRYKRYPRVAQDNNWQGRVEIRMAIGANGAISDLSVRASTGHVVLDQQALEMIERANAMAPIPPALRGKHFVVDIPVVFSLLEPGV